MTPVAVSLFYLLTRSSVPSNSFMISLQVDALQAEQSYLRAPHPMRLLYVCVLGSMFDFVITFLVDVVVHSRWCVMNRKDRRSGC